MEELNHIKKLINKGKLNDAIDILHNSIIENPNNDEALFLLGNAFYKKNDIKNALKAYNQAIEINPNSPAKVAKNYINDILLFYNHDLYNP